jgi:ABC-type antimicrobial peptide transport system permease subunit
LFSPEPPLEIVLTQTQGPDYKLRELNARLISDKSRMVIGTSILVLIGVIVVSGILGIVVVEIHGVSTDPIERVLLPVVTALAGAFCGLWANGNSK